MRTLKITERVWNICSLKKDIIPVFAKLTKKTPLKQSDVENNVDRLERI